MPIEPETERGPRAAPSAASARAATTGARRNALLVVDRRELMRGCLLTWLSSLRDEFEVIGIDDVSSCVESSVSRVDLVILSIGAPGQWEVWLQEQMIAARAQWAEVPIVMITEPDKAHGEEELVRRHGLRGFIPTSTNIAVAAAALHLILAGGTYLPAAAPSDVPIRIAPAPAQAPISQPEIALDSGGYFTPREGAVLDLLQQGMANKIIAFRLSMSQSTVKVHVHNIMKKLNARNRTEAAVIARSMARRKRPSPTVVQPTGVDYVLEEG